MPATTQLAMRIDPGARDGQPDLARQRVAGLVPLGQVLCVPSAHRVWLLFDLGEPDLVLFPFLVQAPLGLPNHPARHNPTFETAPGQPAAYHREALTYGETRVLRYLPTNLTVREIADELYLSVNTVKTHQRHLYQKLAARSRSQAVERARTLGLLAPASRRPGRE